MAKLPGWARAVLLGVRLGSDPMPPAIARPPRFCFNFSPPHTSPLLPPPPTHTTITKPLCADTVASLVWLAQRRPDLEIDFDHTAAEYENLPLST